MKRRLAIGLALFAFLVVMSKTSEASEVNISYNVAVTGGCSGSSSGPTYFDTCTSEGVTTTVSADASLNRLKLYLDSRGTFSSGFESTGAHLVVTDTLTVTGGTGSGTLTWNWTLDGTLASSDAFYSTIYLYLNGGPTTNENFIACGDNVAFASQFCNSLDANVTVAQTVPVVVPFVFDVPLTVSWSLNAGTGSGCAAGNNCNNPTTGSGTVDFFNTAQLQPLIVRDGNGTQVGGASALSTSGFSYAIAPIPSTVPEPSYLLLLSTGLVAIVARRQFLRDRR